jgi:hypothetical protein
MTIEVFDIAGRKRPPDFAELEQLERDFELTAAGTVDADTLLANPRVSLYRLDHARRVAVFVECPAPIDLTAAPFLFLAQATHATRLFLVPYEELHALAARRPLVERDVVWFHSVGRCGSTLMSKMLAVVPGTHSLSEPIVYDQLATWQRRQQIEPPELIALIRSCTALLAKPGTRLIVKFKSEVIEMQAALRAAVPGARTLFMYRNALDVAQSFERAFGFPDYRRHWLLRLPVLFHVNAHWRPAAPLTYEMHQPDRFRALIRHGTPEHIVLRVGHPGYYLLEWLHKVDCYLKLHAADPGAVAVRYEDLVAQPTSTLTRLFAHFGFPTEAVAAAARISEKDSQEGTGIGKDGRPVYRLDALDRASMRFIFAWNTTLGTPDVILPGTLRGDPTDRAAGA